VTKYATSPIFHGRSKKYPIPVFVFSDGLMPINPDIAKGFDIEDMRDNEVKHFASLMRKGRKWIPN